MDGLTAPFQQATATLPQPYYPGVNGISAAAAEALDPNFRPNVVDSFDLTIQRQLSRKVILKLATLGAESLTSTSPSTLTLYLT